MSGPSLHKQDAHELIHEAALEEARELRDLYQRCLEEKAGEKALKVAEVIIEHWESRTLQHAHAEEEGLYKDILKNQPEMKEKVVQLTRDHDLMRKSVQQLKQYLQEEKMGDRFLSVVDALIIIDEFHNEDEVHELLDTDKKIS